MPREVRVEIPALSVRVELTKCASRIHLGRSIQECRILDVGLLSTILRCGHPYGECVSYPLTRRDPHPHPYPLSWTVASYTRLGPPPLLHDPPSALIRLPFRAPHAERGSIWALLDAHHAHLRALRMLLTRILHLRVPLASGLGRRRARV